MGHATPQFLHRPWASHSLPQLVPSSALRTTVGMHTTGAYHLHHPGPPSSESSIPLLDLLLPLPHTVLAGMTLCPGAPVPLGHLQLHSGLPDAGPEVTSGWPLSVAKTAKCAGRVLSSSMTSRGGNSERRRGKGEEDKSGEGETQTPRAGSGWEGLEERVLEGSMLSPPGPRLPLPFCFSHFSVAPRRLRPHPYTSKD